MIPLPIKAENQLGRPLCSGSASPDTHRWRFSAQQQVGFSILLERNVIRFCSTPLCRKTLQKTNSSSWLFRMVAAWLEWRHKGWPNPISYWTDRLAMEMKKLLTCYCITLTEKRGKKKNKGMFILFAKTYNEGRVASQWDHCPVHGP